MLRVVKGVDLHNMCLLAVVTSPTSSQLYPDVACLLMWILHGVLLGSNVNSSYCSTGSSNKVWLWEANMEAV